ncbi:proline dehydrogenase [Desulfuromonas versatilis]|uniref:proline dehydrogenase n=1 Tax=Desulfuromonas versatilis TaxID=2802975 RepID=A0ABM8I0N3_9BACT|nr:proline dehydrogenase family protein [Desulfuromonas versatilis]BCR06384.1 proline dehydrogenase [Desulfuromonas versatilis]
MSLFNLLVSKTIMHIPGPMVGYFARDYIAGEKLQDAVNVTREFNSQGIMSTIDVLGEFITTLDQARGFKEQCLEILHAIDREKLDANLSLKPTQMGLLLDKQQAFANIREIVALADRYQNFVRIDMEDISCTDDTIDFYRRLREEFPGRVGVVLQSYLRRTPADIESLSDQPMNFRLCKGIYNEPRSAAYKDPAVINRSFVHCLDKMFQNKAYVGIATHDEKLVFEALRLIENYGLKREDYEFQMLLGVDEELRRIIVDAGHRLRVYVPFGESWLPYSRRRLKENPMIAQHALRQMLGLKRY